MMREVQADLHLLFWKTALILISENTQKMALKKLVIFQEPIFKQSDTKSPW